MSTNFAYHIVDFLLPAQKFNIQFSYVSQKRLPFIREFVLRLVNVAPMSKFQIATFFGMSPLEADVAISDLVDRDELTISGAGLLILTNKSQEYFSDSLSTPLLPSVEDSSTTLCFDLATFSCFGNQNTQDYWKAGLKLHVDNINVANSEKVVEKNFQSQFCQILDNGYLPSYFQMIKEKPSVYAVNNVKKIRDLPMRLQLEFKMDSNGKAVVREDFKQLNTSEPVHELMAITLSKQVKKDNSKEILDTMIELDDKYTINVFHENVMRVNPLFISDLNKLEEYKNIERMTFLGPIYTHENIVKLDNILVPIITRRIKAKEDLSGNKFIWIAPSDPFWGKNVKFIDLLNTFISRSRSREKILYQPILYVPIGGIDDKRSIREWERELKQYDNIRGIKEGFLGGNVEIIYLENELVVVIYHVSSPDVLPLTMPVGFISTNVDMVKNIGGKMQKYIKGVSSHGQPNDCGNIIS